MIVPRWRARLSRALTALALACLFLAAVGPALAVEPRPKPRPPSDAELIEGFVQTVFGSEVTGPDDGDGAQRILKKFTGPIAYHLVSGAAQDHRALARAFLTGLDRTVANLTLRETGSIDLARLVVFLVDRADYASTIRATAWSDVNIDFMLENACSAVLRARRSGIEYAQVYIVVDEGFIGLSHCLVEEILQSLGPANDSQLLPRSIFNDASLVNVFGVFDWFILSMLYDPRLTPGMSEAEVRPLLPAVIADTRRRLPLALAAGTGLAHH